MGNELSYCGVCGDQTMSDDLTDCVRCDRWCCSECITVTADDELICKECREKEELLSDV